jgi:hypothetical protein
MYICMYFCMYVCMLTTDTTVLRNTSLTLINIYTFTFTTRNCLKTYIRCSPTFHSLHILRDNPPYDLNISGRMSGENDVYKPIVKLFDNPAFSIMDYTSAAHT